uniref:Bm9950 n=1 Tax=Brugia malayi TaxID=6279 RepID=A0A1I9G2G8_BRUMA|nr:Bm9950 [Brugia malayi]
MNVCGDDDNTHQTMPSSSSDCVRSPPQHYPQGTLAYCRRATACHAGVQTAKRTITTTTTTTTAMTTTTIIIKRQKS